MITTYIGPKLYPGALSDCAASVLATISKSGVWIPDFSAVSYDQQKAILLLRNSGYIEVAAYVGYRVKANQFTIASQKDAPETPAAAIAAILRDAGIEPVGEIRECHDIRKRPGAQPSWAIELPVGARIPADVWEKLAPGCWRSGNLYVVQLKG